MGSAQPVADAISDNLGQGYVRIIDSLLAAVYPEISVRVVNAGISGNTSRELLNRFERDVMDQKPDWVSVCIGINDVWRQFDAAQVTELSVFIDEYEDNMEKMIKRARPCVKGMFILTPFYIENLREDKMRSKMDEYGAVCKRLAEKYDCVLVDIQKLFEDYCKVRHSASLAWDRVHPNQRGAVLMAREFLSRCGFEYNR